MKIKEKIQADLKEAMRLNDTLKRDILRLLSSAIKNAEIGKGEKSGEISDSETVKIISQSAKQHRESVRQYTEGGRSDLAKKEEQELKIILNYLPQQLTIKEIQEIVDKIIIQTKSQSESDAGKVMGVAMKQMAGRADGNLVKEIAIKSLKAKE